MRNTVKEIIIQVEWSENAQEGERSNHTNIKVVNLKYKEKRKCNPSNAKMKNVAGKEEMSWVRRAIRDDVGVTCWRLPCLMGSHWEWVLTKFCIYFIYMN